MAPASVSTGFQTTRTGTSAASSSGRPPAATARDLREGLLAVQALAAGQEPDL